MKKQLLLVIIAVVGVLTMAGCTSKEKRADKLIKEEMNKTLYDIDSYQPVETIVREAKCTRYNDSACWNKAAVLAYSLSKANEYFDEAKDAKNHMLIWGRPTSYSSSFSDNNYNENKMEYIKNLERAYSTLVIMQRLAKDLHEMVENLDTTKVIGWEVEHTFRCKTRGGSSTIGNYRYVTDKKFKTILLKEDLEDSDNRTILEEISDPDNLSVCSEEFISSLAATISGLNNSL